jgi:hypothetical protein
MHSSGLYKTFLSKRTSCTVLEILKNLLLIKSLQLPGPGSIKKNNRCNQLTGTQVRIISRNHGFGAAGSKEKPASAEAGFML